MALDPSTTEKLGNWFNTQATPAQQDPAVSGQGMIGSVQSSFDPDSGVFGVQTATAGTPAPTTPTMLNLGDLDRRTVDAGKETVAGQLDSILKQDSPLMESARARAKQEANSRGLLNSTMAATAGEKAMIDSAMPIAQADAGTHGKAADYNVALVNQGRLANMDAANKAATQQVAIDADKGTQERDIQAKYKLQEMQGLIEKMKTESASADKKESTRLQLLHDVLNSTELSPDRKAALFTELGEPGLAGAIYVVGSVGADLQSTTMSGVSATPTGGLLDALRSVANSSDFGGGGG
jgi:hypothetical protein